MAFGRLASFASGPLIQKVADQISPVIQDQLQKLPQFGAAKLKDQEFFRKYAVSPAWLAVEGATSGLTKLYPPLETKFEALMVCLRDELLIFEGESVSVVDDAKDRIGPAIVAGLKNA